MKIVIALLLVLLASPAYAQDVFTVNAKINCGTNFSSMAISRTLTAGIHTFTLSDAWSPYGGNGANGGNSWGMYMYIHIASTGEVKTFASSPAWHATPAEADAAADGLVFSFELLSDSVVHFYNPDSFLNGGSLGICGDNRGFITVTLDGSPVAVDNASWGTLKASF